MDEIKFLSLCSEKLVSLAKIQTAVGGSFRKCQLILTEIEC